MSWHGAIAEAVKVGYNPNMKVQEIFKLQAADLKFAHAYIIKGFFDSRQIAKILGIKGPDLLEIKEKDLKINSIRELIHWLALKPHSPQRKMAIIYQAETMTREAANALLKTLEEPPKDSLLILQVENLARILPTIASRCQLIRGEQITPKDLPPDYQSPEILGQKSLKERFDYASKISESENLPEIINAWEKYFSCRLLRGEDCRAILSKISQTRDLLLTNTSVKLLLENLLLDF